METSEKPGLLEHICDAVQPLTADGMFFLDVVKYETYYGETCVRLRSKEIDIIFKTNLTVTTEIFCTIRSHKTGKMFFTNYLFQALNINIPNKAGFFISDLDLQSLPWDRSRYQQETDLLLDKTCFIENLHRSCEEIRKKLSEILYYFHSDKIDETTHLYCDELRKHENNGLF